jgi:hypothetical protein
MKKQCSVVGEAAEKIESGHRFVLARLIGVEEEILAKHKQLCREAEYAKEKARHGRKRRWLKHPKRAAKALFKLLESGALGARSLNEWDSGSVKSGSKERLQLIDDTTAAAAQLSHLLCSLDRLSKAVKAIAIFVNKLGRELSTLGSLEMKDRELHWKKMTKRAGRICVVCDHYMAAKIEMEAELVRIRAKVTASFEQKWLRSWNLQMLSSSFGDAFVDSKQIVQLESREASMYRESGSIFGSAYTSIGDNEGP